MQRCGVKVWGDSRLIALMSHVASSSETRYLTVVSAVLSCLYSLDFFFPLCQAKGRGEEPAWASVLHNEI